MNGDKMRNLHSKRLCQLFVWATRNRAYLVSFMFFFCNLVANKCEHFVEETNHCFAVSAESVSNNSKPPHCGLTPNQMA